ncbi:hypothetical protein [Flavobacterium beibuense]|nr:hypothetical protein [Flavobacterium beibuense]
MKILNFKYILFILLMGICSCSSRSDFERLLTDKKWLFRKDSIKEGEKNLSYYVFDRNGIYRVFDLPSNYEYLRIEEMPDSKKWSYDKEINNLIIGDTFKVLSYNENEIQMLMKRDSLRVFLYRLTEDNYDPEHGMKID